jgi:hypothetical protein
MDPVTITICGQPNRDTLAALCELAMNAGLGLMLQPRTLPALPEVRIAKALPPKPRTAKAKVSVVPRTVKDRVSTPPPFVERSASRLPPNKQAAAGRRDAVVGALRRVGSVGLSFKALLDAVRPHLLAAGDSEQQVSALRNALTVLGTENRIERVAGQWVAKQ